jgi:hypothetical protein
MQRDDIKALPIEVRDGYFHVFHVSDRPGLGHDLSEAYRQQTIPD